MKVEIGVGKGWRMGVWGQVREVWVHECWRALMEVKVWLARMVHLHHDFICIVFYTILYIICAFFYI